MKYIFLLLLSFSVHAENFDFYLPINTQDIPEILADRQYTVNAGIIDGNTNFRTQVLNKTDEVKFVSGDEGDERLLSLAFAYGIGGHSEIEFKSIVDGTVLSYKYGLTPLSRQLTQSVSVGYISSTIYGHGGAILDDDSECSAFDIFCMMIDSLSCLWNCDSGVSYEYDYEGDLSGLFVSYSQGYKYSASTLLYWGVQYAKYDIEINVTDNTNSGLDSREQLSADLGAITTGVQWKLFKSGAGNIHFIQLSVVPYKFSTSHDGNIDPEIRMFYKVEF